jgi:hypothetical protein
MSDEKIEKKKRVAEIKSLIISSVMIFEMRRF